MQDHESQAWLAARRLGIGGSDWAHALALDPWGCRRYLVYHKNGTEPDFEQVVTGAMRRGHALEQPAAEEFEQQVGAKVIHAGLFDFQRPPKLPEWWIGNPDRIILNTKTFDGNKAPGVLEIKTKAPHLFQQVKRDGVPDGEVAQVQHYMTLTGLSWAVYWLMDPLNFDRVYMAVFESDPELTAQMLVAGEQIMRMVENGPLPDRLEADDKRCRRCVFRLTCQGERIQAVTGEDPAKDYTFSTDERLPVLIDEYEEAKALEKDAKSLKDAKRDEIIQELGLCKLQDPVGLGKLIVNEQAGRKSIDTKQLFADHPEIDQARYTITGASFKTVRTYPGRK